MLVKFRAIDRYLSQLCTLFGDPNVCKLLREEKETSIQFEDLICCLVEGA